MNDQVYITACLEKGSASDFCRAADMYEACGNRGMVYLCLLRALDIDPSLRDVYGKLRGMKNPMLLDPVKKEEEDQCSISVIMPTLGKSDGIRESIASVLNQTFCDFELIVINDGGPDEVADVVASLASDKIHYRKIEHRGLAGALNEGLRRARGRYICYLDDDDVYYPDHLKKMWHVVSAGKIEWAYSKSRVLMGERTGGKFQSREDLGSYTRAFSAINLQYGCIISVLNVIHTRELAYKLGGFNEDLKHSMDWDMWVRMAQVSTPKFINIFTGEYRKTAMSMTMSNKEFGLFSTQLLSRYYQSAFGRCVLAHAAKAQGYTADVDNILADMDGKYSTISRADVKKMMGLFVEMKKGCGLWRKMIQEQPEELVSESFKILWQNYAAVQKSGMFPWRAWLCEAGRQPLFAKRLILSGPKLISNFVKRLFERPSFSDMHTPLCDDPVVLCVTDNNYALALTVMLWSMQANLSRYSKIHVWIVDGGISRQNRRKMKSSLSGTKLVLHWVAAPDWHQFEGVPVFGHVGRCTYYKIITPQFLPQDNNRVIYLDCDIIVTGDIGELWDVDIKGYALGAIRDWAPTFCSRTHLLACKGVHASNQSEYFNAGVLVLDLEMWRKNRISDEVLSFIKQNKENIRWHDQDGLNAVFVDQWYKFEDRWNQRVDCAKKDEKGELSGLGFRSCCQDGIIHYASKIKPWDYEAVHSGKELFFKYLDKTAWSGWRPRKPVWRIFWRNAERTWLNKHFYGMWIRRIPILGRLWALARVVSKIK